MGMGNGVVAVDLSGFTRCPLAAAFMKQMYVRPETGEMVIEDTDHSQNLLSAMGEALRNINLHCANCDQMGLHDPMPTVTSIDGKPGIFNPAIKIDTEILV